jgi:ABC-2 type transport system ATP-binding protein
MTTVIEVQHMRKRYGDTAAVDDVSFTVEEGEIFGILGPNGAGKTTTVECIEGLRTPDSGTISVLGLDPIRDRGELRQRVGAQLQDSELPERLRVGEALELYSSFYRKPADWHALMDMLGLAGKRDTRFGKLSGGQKQRLSIALALVGSPRVAVLDELTTGLDPQARRDTWALIEGIRDTGVTILLVTHFMEEAERLCDRVALIDSGKIVALDSPAGLTVLDAYIPILVALVIAMLALSALPSVLASYREKGVLRRIATTPVGPGRVLAAQLAVNVVTFLVTLVLLLAVARLAYGVPLARQFGGFVLAVGFAIAALFGIGLFIAAIASTGRAAQATGTILFFPMMFFAALLAVAVESPTTTALAVNAGLALLAAAWMLWFFTLHPRRTERSPLLVFSVVGLLVIMAVMVVYSPIYGIYSWTGYFFVYRLPPARPRLLGAFVVAVTVATSQAGGLPRTGTAGLIYAVLLLFNVALAIGFTWFASLSHEQNERRKQLVEDLSEANRKLEATLAENAGLHEQLLVQAREAGISDERQRMAREIHDTLAQGLPPDVEVTLLRTAQEALANVAKHAGATRVGLTLSFMDDDVALDVRDDGVGFDPAGRRTTAEGGFGLTAMRQRVEGLAGMLGIESEPGAGTAISACIPAVPGPAVPGPAVPGPAEPGPAEPERATA